MTTSANRAIYNERRRRLAQRDIPIPDLFGQDTEPHGDPGDLLAEPDPRASSTEFSKLLDADPPRLTSPC